MTKDWNFNQPLESKSENQEDPDKIAALFGNHQGGNDVNYEAAFQKRKQAPVTESNSSSKPKVTEVRTGKETDITTSYQQHLKRLIADNNSDIESSHTLRKSNSNHVSFTLPYSSTACG